MKTRNTILTGCLCALGCETIYGMSYVFTKQATDCASSLALLGWRFIIAAFAMTLCAMVGVIKINLKGKNLKTILLVAIFNPVIYFVGETIGIIHTTASESGAFLACIPVASLLASTILLHEKPTKAQVTGISVTLVGVGITVFAVGISSSLSFVGYLMLVVAVTSYALYCVFVEKATDYTSGEITYVMLLAGAILFGTLAVGEGIMNQGVADLVSLPFRNLDFGVAILYQGLGSSVAGFLLSNMAISRIGVNATSAFIGVSTVVSILAGALLLHESFTLYQGIGAVVIVAGVYIANLRFKKNEGV